jgi:hypothetical protein
LARGAGKIRPGRNKQTAQEDSAGEKPVAEIPPPADDTEPPEAHVTAKPDA